MDCSEKALSMVKEMMAKGTLPALSENVSDICKITEASETSTGDLAAVIMRDCGLTSNIITSSNSVLYSPRVAIKTVSGAVTFLGFNRVRSLALGLAIFKDTMSNLKDKNLANLYAKSYFSGSFAMGLARMANMKEQEEIFVAGLLYQLPRVALANTYPKEFHRMREKAIEENIEEEAACREVFEVTYFDLCEALVRLYNLPGKISKALLGRGGGDPVTVMVHQSATMANMMFKEVRGGPEALSEVEQSLRPIMRGKNFSVANFIKKNCRADSNIKKLFKLENSEIDTMIKSVEKGTTEVEEVTSRIIVSEEPCATETVRPDQLFGSYITEIMMARRRGDDINKVLMLTQETLFKCLPNSFVFVSFLDRRTKHLKARFYAGNIHLPSADIFSIPLTDANSLLIKSMRAQETVFWKINNGHLGIPAALQNSIPFSSAVFAPIIVENRPVGLYFVGRIGENSQFLEIEELWFEEVVDHVCRTFELIKRRKGSK